MCAAGTLAAVLASASAVPLSTSHGASVTPGSRYLALGDSVTFGTEDPGVVPAPNYKDPSSFVGYPDQVGAELHLKVVNAACPGETASSMINPSAQSLGCENTVSSGPSAYRPNYPLHVHYQGSQLAYALEYLHTHSDVRLVSLMIGANDVYICVLTTRDGYNSKAEQQAALGQLAHWAIDTRDVQLRGAQPGPDGAARMRLHRSAGEAYSGGCRRAGLVVGG